MAALAVDTPLAYQNVGIRNTQSPIIKNGTQLYVGGLCDIVAGVAQPHAAGSGTCIAGIAVGPGVPGDSPVLDGNTFPIGPAGGSSAIPPGNVTSKGYTGGNQVVLEEGRLILLNVTIAVAGTLNGTYTNDIGKELYCATDNPADASTTQTSSDAPLGHICNWHSYDSTAATEVVDIEVLDFVTRKGY